MEKKIKKKKKRRKKNYKSSHTSIKGTDASFKGALIGQRDEMELQKNDFMSIFGN